VVSLIVPTLAGFQEQARRTKCLGNLQQFGEALHLYGNDFKGAFPLMPVPSGSPVVQSQWRYGGVSGLLSLWQVGDGRSIGYGGDVRDGLPYSNGNREPLLESYISTLATLRCPADREDRYYGFPYSPSGALSLAAAPVYKPEPPAKSLDVVTYNVSYYYVAGAKLHGSAEPLIGDETNGPDLGDWAWYGSGAGPASGPTPNSAAAGAASPGVYARADNHKAAGGNQIWNHGGGGFSKQPPRVISTALQPRLIMD
jgi:hypothetical protein